MNEFATQNTRKRCRINGSREEDSVHWKLENKEGHSPDESPEGTATTQEFRARPELQAAKVSRQVIRVESLRPRVLFIQHPTHLLKYLLDILIYWYEKRRYKN